MYVCVYAHNVIDCRLCTVAPWQEGRETIAT